MITRFLPTCALMVAMTAIATAAALQIDGTYGNPAGCKLALTGNYGEDESARFMTADSLQTMVTACTFTEIKPVSVGRQQVSLTCASEGSGPEDNYFDTAEISGDATRGYIVRFADGSDWERLTKC